MNSITSFYPENQVEMYELLKKQLVAVLENERNKIANLANCSAILKEALKDTNWVGFYLMNEDELILGPFQGKVACVHISLGKGVCGTAAKKNETMLVSDVHAFSGHIACDSASNSEVVIPLRYQGKVVGVLDIDSPLLNRFNETDALQLEDIAEIIEESCDWTM